MVMLVALVMLCYDVIWKSKFTEDIGCVCLHVFVKLCYW